MALDDDIRSLSRVALFQSLDGEQLRLLAFGAQALDLRAGSRLYREGDTADCAFVIVSGRIALSRERDGVRQDVGTVERGACLGELALIAEGLRLTDAVVEVQSHLLRIDRRPFMRILEEYPALAAKLYDRIADDLQTLVNRLDRLSPHFEV